MKQFIILFFIIISSSTLNSQIPNTIPKEDKVYGLSKFWQEVNYNFIYLNKIDRNEWDKMFKKYLIEVQETENDYAYYRLLQKFCAYLNDGHTNIWFPKEIQDNILTTDFGAYRIFLSNIENKVIITKVNTSKKDELPIGTEIVKVNGVSAQQYINQHVKPYISSSTKHILNDLSVKNLLQGYVGSTYTLELKLPNNKVKTLKLTLQKSDETALYPEDKTELFEFKWIGKDIVYISLNSFDAWDIMNLFSEKLPEIRKAKKLIIDLRKNGGGNGSVGREIIKYLTNDTILYGAKSQSRLHIPSFKAWGQWTKAKDTIKGDWHKQAYSSYHDQFYHDFPYNGYSTASLDIKRTEIPTAILIGHRTASAAEDFLIYADNQEHMIKIGEPTFGSTGQPMVFSLPNEGGARVCTKKDTYADGREFVGYGITPDIEVKRTLSDYMENKDPVLKKAIAYLMKL